MPITPAAPQAASSGGDAWREAVVETEPAEAAPGPGTPDGPTLLLITCEHGGHEVPPPYRDLFAGHEEVLDSHRGWDPGALVLARELADAFGARLFAATTTRLLVDLNRSIGSRTLFSEFTRGLPVAARERIVATHYRPHVDAVEGWVREQVGRGARVVHIASHSFTPELAGELRRADVGLLYDPARGGEVALAARWLAALRAQQDGLRLRRNYPYLGKGDGLTFRLRREHRPAQYVGIELEVNQQFARRGGPAWTALRSHVIAALKAALSPGAARDAT